MLTAEVLIQQIVQKAEPLRVAYAEHLADYDELLPHVFMGDVTRYVMKLQRKITQGINNGSEDQLSALLNLFERALVEGDPYVQELVVISFLENLEHDDPDYIPLKKRLGKELTMHLNVIEQAYL